MADMSLFRQAQETGLDEIGIDAMGNKLPGGSFLDPMSMMKGPPSFKGGNAGPAISSASSDGYAAMNSPFIVTTGGDPVERLGSTVLPMLVLGVAIWAVVKTSR